MKTSKLLPVLAVGVAVGAAQAQTQTQGPTSSRAPYLVPTAAPGVISSITSIVTTTDLVPATNGPAGATAEYGGIPDGLGEFDNGDGTITIVSNHELLNNQGVVRRHGAIGAYVTELIVDKQTLAVVSISDLMQNVIDINGVVHNAANSNGTAFNRFCSGDLPAVTAFYNPATGYGTQERIYMHGEEGGATGWNQATVVTGPEKGNSYTLAKMNLSTNGSGLSGVGAWENTLANPFPQDLTVIAADNDGGTGIMTNSVAIYVGNKLPTGNAVQRAGLTNGTLYFVNVVGNPVEITNSTSRATGITSGTRFLLASTSSTTFSRPEDGAWNPLDPRQFYFVTTDRLDASVSTGPNPTVGASGAPAGQIGMSRLWRLTFDDITQPQLGGVIDLLIDGGKADQKVNMFDNLTAAADGRVYLDEDTGNTTYNGKVWAYDPATDQLAQLTRFDPALWGDLAAAGGTPGATLPHNNDKETSGVLDVTHLFPHAPGETVLLLDVQDHSTNAGVADAATVEGGQLLLIRLRLDASVTAYGIRCGRPGPSLVGAPGSLPRIGETQLADIDGVPTGAPAFMSVGFSNTVAGAIPLPLELSSFGMPGCFLYHDCAYGFAIACAPTSPTQAQFSLPIPGASIFLGMRIHLQAWAPEAAANPAGIVASNALQLTLGL
jgi:hypothetical protein